MIVEECNYLVKPGAAAKYAQLWAEYGREPQVRVLGNLLGFYVTGVGELNMLVHLWGYEGPDDRARRRAELAADPGFAAFRNRYGRRAGRLVHH